LVDGSEKEPGGGAFDGPLEVFGEAAVSVEPGDGAFNDPPARE